MHHLLWSGGGHSHLHLWTHVSVQQLWAEAEETDQCMLSNMQEAYQRCYQNISAMMIQMLKQVLCLPVLDATYVPFSGLVGQGSWPQLEISQTRTWLCLSFILSIISGETAGGHLNTKTAYMSFILAKKEDFCAPILCLLCHMYLLSRKATCTYFVFTLIVLDLCVLQQNMPPVVYDF